MLRHVNLTDKLSCRLIDSKAGSCIATRICSFDYEPKPPKNKPTHIIVYISNYTNSLDKLTC